MNQNDKTMAQTFSIKFFGMRGVNVPLIEGTFRDKDGNPTPCYFQIDTGSLFNVLNPAILDWIGKDGITDNTLSISAIDSIYRECPVVNLEIGVGDIFGTEHFCLAETTIFTDYFGDLRIVGLLGTQFLLEHELVVDFENRTLRSFSDVEATDFQGMSFLFPMKLGLEKYGVPLVAMIKDEKLFMFVADSGCDFSMVTKYAIENGSASHEFLALTRESSDLFTKREMQFAKAKFNLAGYDITSGGVIPKCIEHAFEVMDDRDCIRESNDESMPPLSGLFGCEMMLRNKWILDYKRLIIYSNAA